MPRSRTTPPLRDIRLTANPRPNAAGQPTTCDLRVTATVLGKRVTAVAGFPVDSEDIATAMATHDLARALRMIRDHPSRNAVTAVGLLALLPHAHALHGLLLEAKLADAAQTLRAMCALHAAWETTPALTANIDHESRTHAA